MSEVFYDGYSQYELQALKIPSEARGKCLKQLVDFTTCYQKAGTLPVILKKACLDEQFRFDRCHQRSVNYYTAATVGTMLLANASAFHDQGVSPTYEQGFFSIPTALNFTR